MAKSPRSRMLQGFHAAQLHHGRRRYSDRSPTSARSLNQVSSTWSITSSGDRHNKLRCTKGNCQNRIQSIDMHLASAMGRSGSSSQRTCEDISGRGRPTMDPLHTRAHLKHPAVTPYHPLAYREGLPLRRIETARREVIHANHQYEAFISMSRPYDPLQRFRRP